MSEELDRQMPDIAQETSSVLERELDWVGMSKIETAVKLKCGGMPEFFVPAMADAFVNICDPKAKGIHMSRLFLELHSSLETTSLSAELLEQVAVRFLETHTGISDKAKIELEFRVPSVRSALKSQNSALRHYPAKISIKKKAGKESKFEVFVRVPYSSTCPCSAALARQLIQEKFSSDFADKQSVNTEDVAMWLGKESSITATPHSQRSYADIVLKFKGASMVPSFEAVIDLVESTLKTAVQAAVKREDEQEFARLNATNLMFCEDAARKLAKAFDGMKSAYGYKIHVSHHESLHPHNAEAIVKK